MGERVVLGELMCVLSTPHVQDVADEEPRVPPVSHGHRSPGQGCGAAELNTHRTLVVPGRLGGFGVPGRENRFEIGGVGVDAHRSRVMASQAELRSALAKELRLGRTVRFVTGVTSQSVDDPVEDALDTIKGLLGWANYEDMIPINTTASEFSCKHVTIYESVDLWSFRPISALCRKNNPRNITHMPPVIFSACLDLERKSS